MNVQRFVLLVLVLCLGVSTACQLSLGKSGLGSQKSKAIDPVPRATTPSAPEQKGSINKEYEACRQQVSQKFVNGDFEWIDREASRLRVTKERLPGGYWKLRALYEGLEVPQTKGTDAELEAHITKLNSWIKQRPRSITARVALAQAWKDYAWKARGSGYADSVKNSSWPVFQKRLANASRVLDDAASLDERCPHWYVMALWVGIGERWDRPAFERMFKAAVELEPTYYYLHQTMATYLLPRWYGEEGEWERFAEESTLKVGGPEGDIIFFAIYSQMKSFHGTDFMNTHKAAGPRLLAGFRSIEKLHGVSTSRMNEACYFAMFSGDSRTAAELFNRIGEDFDPAVWRTKEKFELWRQGALMLEKNRERNSAQSGSRVK